MLRSILAAVVGYAAIVIVVFTGIGVAWLALGGAGAFNGEGPAPSTPWMALNLLSGLIAAVVGGLVARRIGGSQLAVRILVGIVLVLGVVSAVMAGSAQKGREPVEKPVAEMTFQEAGRHAVQPAWYNWIIPLVGAAGALVGGRERS